MRAVVLALLLPAAAAASPVQITHQARLLDEVGAAIDGPRTVRVGLWDAATGGTERWGEDFSLTVEQGFLAVTLGADTANNPLDSSLFAAGPLYVQLSVGGDPLGPREPLTPVPFAVHATSVTEGVPVGTILPFGGSAAALGDTWMVCNGATVTNPGSGLVDFNPGLAGVQVPNLQDSRFLMGVAAGSVGSTGGRNDIPSDGSHTHTFSQTYTTDMAPDASSNTSGSYTNPAGAHTHGGENRPAYLGVQFIIRVR